MPPPELTCVRCGASFRLPEHLIERYAGWTPDLCRSCYQQDRTARSGSSRSPSSRRAASRQRPSSGGGGRSRKTTVVEENLTTAEVLERYHDGPTTGVFTDGSAVPNPGPGGWGAVYVIDDEIVAQEHGHDPETTNNRMEFTAIIRGAALVPAGTEATVHTDSRYCHDTITSWAAGWEKRGWKRKTGEVQNLDLVKVAFEVFRSRPELSITWVPAHSGYRWNEYADSLSTAWMRAEV